jgi:hypothetical protein
VRELCRLWKFESSFWTRTVVAVATDEETALELEGASEDLAGTVCHVVKLNVATSEPRYRDDGDETNNAVDVEVPEIPLVPDASSN